LVLFEKEVNLEQAKKGQILDFVQINYRGPHTDAVKERFSIGAAFNLNNSGSRKLKIEELNLQKQRLAAEMLQDQSILADGLASIQLNIQKDIAFYNYFTEVVGKERKYLNDLVDQLLNKSDFNPLHILNIKERQLQNETEKLKLTRDLFEQYLEFLYKSERICSELAQNFLQDTYR